MNKHLLKILINGTVIFVLMLLLFFASTWWRLQTQFAAGEKAMLNGDFVGAVAGFAQLFLFRKMAENARAGLDCTVRPENQQIGSASKYKIISRPEFLNLN